MELHADIPINHMEKPPIKRGAPPKAGRGLLIFLLLILTLSACGAGWYYYDRYEKLHIRYLDLLQKGESTKLDFSSTASSLDEANIRLAQFKRELGKVKGENQQFSGKNKALNKSVTKKDRELAKLKKNVQQGKRNLSKANDRLAQTKRERDQARSALADMEKDSTQRIQTLESELQDTKDRFRTQVDTLTGERNELRQSLNRAVREKDNIQKQFQDESQASLRIIQDRSRLKRENERLLSDLEKVRTQLTALQKRTTDLENVKLGDLVPYSDEITPAQVSYRDPEGLKIPKKVGRVALQVLVTEVGSVEKAFIIPGQTIDGQLARTIIQSVYKWKFTPPTYKQVRVKTWQTVLVTPE